MLKLKDGFIIRQIGEEKIIIPSGKEYDLDVMITINESGELLWNKLETGCEKADLVNALLEVYDVEESVASASVDKFLDNLNRYGVLK